MPVCPSCGGISNGDVCQFCRRPFDLPEEKNVNVTIHNYHAPVAPPFPGVQAFPGVQPAPKARPMAPAPPPAPMALSSSHSWTLLLVFCIFLGYLGVHRFYVGKTGTGLIWLCTLGCYAVGWIVDIVMILTNSFTDKYGRVIKRHP